MRFRQVSKSNVTDYELLKEHHKVIPHHKLDSTLMQWTKEALKKWNKKIGIYNSCYLLFVEGKNNLGGWEKQEDLELIKSF